ncbi:MAG: NADH-quinone oxidoreductase subunit L, partial [Gammaproteobacteria bacterium]|nr:NADH-quinone oxidoreductase subunit L [Gammaproteobacteria bacterium]
MLLSIGGRAWRRPLTAAIGVGSVGAAALLNVLLGLELLDAPASMVAGQSLWQWFEVADLSVSVNLYLDRLALLMTFVITLVGFLIHLYAAEHMAREDGITDAGHARFFAFLN